MNAARLSRGYERPCDRSVSGSRFPGDSRNLGNRDWDAFNNGRSCVGFHHTVVNMSWRWHLEIIAASPAKIKNAVRLPQWPARGGDVKNGTISQASREHSGGGRDSRPL